MQIQFEKYQTLATSLSLVNHNISNQAITAIIEILEQLPNNEILLDCEDDEQCIWTDNDDRVERVYLFGNEHDKRILLDTETQQCQELYIARELDVLETIANVLTNKD